MSDLDWQDAVEILDNVFPILPNQEDYPSLAIALDEGLDDLLRDSNLSPSPVNPLYVEELLKDCVGRISNCLVLRDKAFDLELRAVGDALAYKAQSASIVAGDTVDRLLNSLAPRSAQAAVKATLTGTQVQFESDPDTWAKVKDAQSALYEELREGLAIQRAKALAPGNGSNLRARFAFVKRLFDLNVVEAYRRAHVCAKGLKEIYGVQADVPRVVARGYLDELSIWAQKASDALDEALDTRYFSDVGFTLAGGGTSTDEPLKEHELVNRSRFNTELAAGRIAFKLTQQHFHHLKMGKPMLRSLRLQVRAKDETKVRVWPAQVVLPSSPLAGTGPVFPCVMPSHYQDAPTQDSVVRGVHNISPIGDWEIRLSDRALTGEPTNTTEVTNVYLFLRVSHVRA